jgi:hypothetical protein
MTGITSDLKPYLAQNISDMQSVSDSNGDDISPDTMNNISVDSMNLSQKIGTKGKPPLKSELVRQMALLTVDEDEAIAEMKNSGDKKGAQQMEKELQSVLKKVAYDGGQGGDREAEVLQKVAKAAGAIENGGSGGSDPGGPLYLGGSDPPGGHRQDQIGPDTYIGHG